MSKVDLVRILIPDLDDTDYIFTDMQLEALLESHDDNANLAAADAIDSIATNEALTYKYVRTDDLTVDGKDTVRALRQRAADLRERDDRSRFDGFTVVYPLGNGQKVEYLWG